ncbi:MAG: MFS transporter [Candidatus Nanopelagicales bacterium]
MTGTRLANRYALLTGMRWFPVGLVFPVIVLIKEARGLDLTTIGQLMALYSIVTVALELPTGGLADVIGRRGVVILASLTSAVSMVVLALATTVPVMATAVVLQGVGRALSSGPLTAWYVDTVHHRDVNGDINVGLSRGEAAEAWGLGIGGVLGGVLPVAAAAVWADLPSRGDAHVITLSVPLLLAAVLSVLHALAAALMVHELPRERQTLRAVTREVPRTVVDGLRLGTRDAVLRRLMLRMMLMGVTVGAVELLTPLRLAELTGSVDGGSAWFGVLGALGFMGTGVGAILAPRAARSAGSGVRVVVVAAFACAPLAALLAVPVLGVVAAAYVLMYALMGLAGPLIAAILHGRVGAQVRSTVLSVESLALQAGAMLASLGVSAFAQAAGLAWGYAVVAIALALTGLLMIGVPPAERADRSADEDVRDGQRGVGRQVEV